MNTTHRLTAGAVAISVAVGLSYNSLQAAHHEENVGKYTTRVQESRLFVDGGTKLRCDLFFSTPGGKTAIAKKDSLVSQQVPAFVWQYSGLLPVSDYLKTVAIHGVATEQKIERWQDVQHTFYDGLRAEGAASTDAKIAFAGAYAFAPRWPLIELVEIADELNIPDTKLYSVSVTDPAKKGLSIDDYRAMARDIFDSPQNVTLQDIRGVIDAVDAGEGNYEESGLLVNLVKKIQGIVKPQSIEPETIEPESMVVDLEPVRLELEAKQMQKVSDQEENGSDEWVRLPDGSAVLAKVASLAQES